MFLRKHRECLLIDDDDDDDDERDQWSGRRRARDGGSVGAGDGRVRGPAEERQQQQAVTGPSERPRNRRAKRRNSGPRQREAALRCT